MGIPKSGSLSHKPKNDSTSLPCSENAPTTKRRFQVPRASCPLTHLILRPSASPALHFPDFSLSTSFYFFLLVPHSETTNLQCVHTVLEYSMNCNELTHSLSGWLNLSQIVFFLPPNSELLVIVQFPLPATTTCTHARTHARTTLLITRVIKFSNLSNKKIWESRTLTTKGPYGRNCLGE